MKSLKWFVFSLVMIAVALACSESQRNGLPAADTTVHGTLLRVEQLIDVDPDSAQLLLCQIVQGDSNAVRHFGSWDSFRPDDEADLALYGLLYAEVLHKRGVKVEVDSLISNSVGYYEQTGEQRRLCKSLLHRAISLQHYHRLSEGAALMKRAETLASDVDDDLLTFDVQMALGDLNRQARCRQLMMDYYRRALSTAHRINLADRQGAIINRMARAYLEVGELDSARLYVGRGLALNGRIDRSMCADLLASKGRLLMEEGRTDEAERLLVQALDSFPCSYASLHLGNLYSKTGNMQLACNRWAEALQALDADIRVEAYRHLISYYEHHEQWRALDLSKQLNELYEQTSIHEDTEMIADVQAKYDSRQAQRRLHNRIWWLCGGCAVLALGCWFLFMSWRRKRRDYRQVLRRIDDLQAQLLTMETGDASHAACGLNDNCQMIDDNCQMINDPAVETQAEALQALLDENLVYWFHRKADAGRQPEHEDWLEMATLFDRYQHGFVQALNRNETLTERDVHICMLIKMRFQPSEIAVLVGASPQTVTNSRTRLLGKIFGEKGGARDFDRRIRQMGSS